jgi:hypothetical protein
MLARSFSVAASRSWRLRLRSAARSGLRQTISRSPGKSGEAGPRFRRRSRRNGQTRGGDGGHIALIKQCELQRPAVQQLLDGRGTQRRDPVQACGFKVLGDARLGDHAAVADQHDAIEVEALLQLLDLWRQGLWIAGVAIEDLDGDWAAVRRAEQAVDDLQRALFAITAVATFGQRAAAAFHVARRNVVEHQRAVGQVALGQDGFDGRLSHQQPVKRGVEFVVIDIAETERFAEAGGRGGGRESPCRGQFRDGIEDAADQHCQGEVAAAIAVRAEDTLEADLAGDADRRRDVAVRQAADDGEGVAPGGNDGATLEHAAQALDRGGRPVREVAEGAFTDLAVLAVALAQQDGGG